jgi:flagellar protein FlgJ
MMFKSMRQASGADEEDGLVEKSFGRGIFEEMRDEELSKKVAEGGGIGIAKVMYRQLKKYTDQTEQTASATLDVKR